jgi:hypothetical protein
MFCTGWEARSAWFKGGPAGMVKGKCFGILIDGEGEGSHRRGAPHDPGMSLG